jgi:hypothetical protein
MDKPSGRTLTVSITMPKRGDPLPRLRRMAERLGWENLRRHRHDRSNDALGTITWYESGPGPTAFTRTFLQINESPIGRNDQYLACVYALRSRLCSGWHFFRLPGDKNEFEECVEQLRPWVSREHFCTVAGRREYRKAHPETTGYTLQFLRRNGEPYVLFDGDAGITCRNTREGWLEAARGDRAMIRRIRKRFAGRA